MPELVYQVDSSVMFVLGVGNSVAHLDEENATMLRDALNEFLGFDKQKADPNPPATIGITFPKGCAEPDLRIGTKLLDDEADTLIRVEGGWMWHEVSGISPWSDDVIPWDDVNRIHSFTVIA